MRQVSGKNCLAAKIASRHQDASPGPLGTDSDPKSAFFRSESGQNQVKIGSESGPNQVRGGGSDGVGSRGRSGWEGSVAPLESLDPGPGKATPQTKIGECSAQIGELSSNVG